jgi:hypothetical protein
MYNKRETDIEAPATHRGPFIQKKTNIFSEVSRNDLDQVEKFADKALEPVDINFTRHFLDRVTDPRNIKPISSAELISFFKGLSKYKTKFLDFLKNYVQFVITHKRYNLNIPFVRTGNRLVAKTIMRKPNFLTSNPKFYFEGVDNSELTMYINELKKGKWQIADTDTRYDELINLVQTAYKKTADGSYVNSKGDVVKSDWLSIDWNTDPKIDATIFYRGARGGEPWTGMKIQGIGHNGDRTSIDIIFKKLKEILNKKGVWVEASDAMEHILYKMGVPFVDDEAFATRIFPNTDLKMTGNRGQYTRKVGSKTIKETIFGKPVVK